MFAKIRNALLCNVTAQEMMLAKDRKTGIIIYCNLEKCFFYGKKEGGVQL